VHHYKRLLFEEGPTNGLKLGTEGYGMILGIGRKTFSSTKMKHKL